MQNKHTLQMFNQLMADQKDFKGGSQNNQRIVTYGKDILK